jgi:hypothetical protein
MVSAPGDQACCGSPRARDRTGRSRTVPHPLYRHYRLQPTQPFTQPEVFRIPNPSWFGSRFKWVRIQAGQNYKIIAKKRKNKEISCLKSSVLAIDFSLKPECPLSWSRSGLDPDSATDWIRSRNQWIRIRNTVQNQINLVINAPSLYISALCIKERRN